MSASPILPVPSTRPFMGANAYNDAAGSGVTFRVWAPFAISITVAGTFNGWSLTGNPFASEGNGFWSADVNEAATGDQYKFLVTNPTVGNLWRMDPYATRIIQNGGNLNGVIDTPLDHVRQAELLHAGM